jgi:hypothetical protein
MLKTICTQLRLLTIFFFILFVNVKGFTQPGKPKAAKETSPEYVDVIELSLSKNSHIDVKGTQPLSVDIGGEKSSILLDIQANSSIVKLKAVKKGFAETNMIIVCKDTVLQFLVRYSEMPRKTYYSYSIAEIKQKGKERQDVFVTGKAESQQQGVQAGAKVASTVKQNIDLGKEKSVSSDKENQIKQISQRDNSKTKWRDSSANADISYGIEGRNQPLGKYNIPVTEETIGISVTPEKSKDESNLPSENKNGTIQNKYLPEEVFEKLRSKKININTGDLDGGVRVVLDRLYKDGDFYYYALTVHNREKEDFLIDYTGFEVHRKSQNQSTNTDIIKMYQPQNNPTVVTTGSKTSLVFSTEKIEMLPEEFLLLTISGSDKEIKIKLKQVDFERASIFSL